MSLMAFVSSTERVSSFLFQNGFPVYAALYRRYKRLTEAAEIALIRRLVRPGDRVVDVGANIGFYTGLLADAVGPRGEVYAFEPDPTNARRLRRAVDLRPEVQVVEAAVTDRTGVGLLYRSPHQNVDHRTYPTDESREQVSVTAVSLDEFFGPAGPAVDFVKMDIQGAEPAALRGMQRLLARSPRVRVLMELWPYMLDHHGPGADAPLELLEALGLEAWRVEGRDGRLGARVRPGATMPGRDDPDVYWNVLCGRPAVLAELLRRGPAG